MSGGAADGLHSVKDLRGEARRLNAEEFCRRYPAPALLLCATGVVLPPGAREGDVTPTERSIKRTVLGDEGAAALNRYDEKVVFLAKRAGNPFPNIVSLGRAMNNDLVFSLETISKLHGFFWHEGDTWSYTDQKSTNGTLVNARPLAPNEKRRLSDGDTLRLGLDLKAIFLLPPTLRSRLLGG